MVMTVTIPYTPLWAPVDWAKEHCPSYISNDIHMDGYNTFDNSKVDYFFSDEKDAMWFKLRWS